MKSMLLLSLLLFQLQPFFAQQIASPLEQSFVTYQQLKANTFFDLKWQSLGPVINSARVEAVQLDPNHPGTMYVAFGSGNLWKTTDHGLKWKPIFEDQAVLGIGDIALAPSHPDVIYLGSGESLKKARNFTMPGNGVYKSGDGGESWKHCGLNDSWHIGEIAVHPTNPDIVVVAVQGHFWSTNPNRGIYRSQDGGESWEQVLYIDEKTGANDIVISPSHPEVMYASMWENNPGVSGKNSGIYVSLDGGQNWERKTNGFPQGEAVGRIGLAVSYSNPSKVYALVDNRGQEAAAEIYRSLDAGENWERTHQEDLQINSVIGWYFTDMYVNPQNDEEIFGLGVRIAHSTNGGKDFELIGGDIYHLFPSDADRLHLDHCELWINPLNPNHLALGNDGGLYVSYNKGGSWMHYNNLPAGEFYDITLDQQDPVNIYAGTQDNATVVGPAREWNPAYADDWRYLWVDAWSGGDGCITQVDPEDPNTVYFSMQNGAIRRKDMEKDRSTPVKPKLPEGHEGALNYNFITPYLISRFDHKTLYHAGNYVFKTSNRGDDWQLISEDLSISYDSDKQSLAAGTLAESPHQSGHLYVGMDKGAFWLTHDDGKNWEERSTGLPNGYIRSIVPSKFKKSRIYLSISGINYDDLANHIYVSENEGKDWRKLKGNLPDEVAYVIYEDPTFEKVLYAGMYRGVYISIDRGATWSLLGKNLPACAIADLELDEKSQDLIVATHGRGIFKINIGPIHEAMTIGYPLSENHLFDLPATKRPWLNDTHKDVDYHTVEKVPITYWSTKSETVDLKIELEGVAKVWSKKWPVKKGFNQFRWDLVVEKHSSQAPYFIHDKEYIATGEYKLVIESSEQSLSTDLLILPGKKRE